MYKDIYNSIYYIYTSVPFLLLFIHKLYEYNETVQTSSDHSI
jgi:hypothetical protein